MGWYGFFLYLCIYVFKILNVVQHVCGTSHDRAVWSGDPDGPPFGVDSPRLDQSRWINSISTRVYPSKLVGVVGGRIGMNPDLFLYI
jgi:hypothetical protein